MRLVLASATLALLSLGCATQPGQTPVIDATPTPTVNTGRVVTTGGNTVQFNTMNLDKEVALTVSGSVDETWAVLPVVYKELAIPLTMSEPKTKTIGNTGWKMRRSIGKVPVYRYMDCGSSGTIQNAETYELTLSIVSQVQPNPSGGSSLLTTITGTGRNPITSNSNEVRCVSTSQLEIRIRDMVQKALMSK
ncbi:MAG: hypothetical protein IT357_13410 [Gemmatimonadaceae bacterium]|nr:hypothetical protein [Gemmatimonadaceae bacterium]